MTIQICQYQKREVTQPMDNSVTAPGRADHAKLVPERAEQPLLSRQAGKL